MTMDTLGSAAAIVGAISGWIFDNPIIALIIVGGVFIGAIARTAAGKRPVAKDERRMFTAQQKAEAKRLAGGRCEHSTLGFRCGTPGAHADHIYPWSRGGATAMTNCQSLCAKHNLQKSAQIPTRFYVKRLEKRRRGYFPAGTSPTVEWRLGLAA
jgi:hypothetical protein